MVMSILQLMDTDRQIIPKQCVRHRYMTFWSMVCCLCNQNIEPTFFSVTSSEGHIRQNKNWSQHCIGYLS